MKTYVEAMSPNRTLASQFGGIVGITSFGEKAIEAFIVLVATELWIKWEQLLENLSSTSEKGYEIMQCETALLVSLINAETLKRSICTSQSNHMKNAFFIKECSWRLHA